MRAHHSSVPQIPLDDHVVEAADDRPNRAARRGNRAGPQPAQGHGRAAPTPGAHRAAGSIPCAARADPDPRRRGVWRGRLARSGGARGAAATELRGQGVGEHG
jgi:hypothetical protein